MDYHELLDFIIKYWLQFIFGGTIAMLGLGYRHLLKRWKKFESVENGIQALLRNSIISLYNRQMERGFCPIYELENIDAMYREYKVLGGNGTIDTLYKKVHGLPSDKPEEEAWTSKN